MRLKSSSAHIIRDRAVLVLLLACPLPLFAQGDASGRQRLTCVIEADTLKELMTTSGPAGLMVDRNGTLTPLDSVAPPARYARTMRWFQDDKPIELRRGRYVRQGPERIMEKEELRVLELYGGMPLFRLPSDTSATPDFLFAPIAPGCQFQPYRYEGPRQIRE
ncbi:MAG: hypothetical protein ABI679_08545 [Gemmatimonadota bacterium]